MMSDTYAITVLVILGVAATIMFILNQFKD